MIAAVLLALAAPRVLSADYCADQFALALADRSQIAALSVDAEKDFSRLREKANEIPQAPADAEQVVAKEVDVVLRFWGGDAKRLERLGVKVVTLAYAADFATVKENLRVAAEALGRPERAEKMIDDIDARLAALRARGPAGVSALYVTPGGVTAGKDTMIDAMFDAAGVGNIAAEQGLSFWPALSAEALVADPPPFVVTGFFSANSERIEHWSATRHPALKKVFAEAPHVDLPADVLSCPAWFSLDGAETIRDAVDALKEAKDE